MGGFCVFCGEELGPDEIEVNDRCYCSMECVREEKLDREAERGLDMEEKREFLRCLGEYDDGIF